MASMIFDSIKTRNLDQVYEINLYQYFQHLVQPGVDTAKINDRSFSVGISTGIKQPEFNAILQTDITDNFEKVFNSSHTFFDEQNIPYTWFIIPSSTPEDLQEKLEGKGLRYIGDDVVVGVELDEMIRNISSPNSLFIKEVQSYEKLEIWADIYCSTRNISESNKEAYINLFKHVDFENLDQPWRKYIGWLNGKPVSASTLVIAGGIAVVYDESLLPKYKGFGIETSINLVPLRKSKQMGMKLGLVPTNVGSIKRFTGIEFTELFRVNKMVYVSRRRGRRRR